jgi:TPR repeat protein
MLRIVILLTCLTQVFALPVESAFAARHALVIGNANYDELTNLQNTHADAEAYHNAFQKLGFNSTLKKDLDLEATWDALDLLLETVRAGDQVAFVYSGHGWSDGLNNFLSPTDSAKSGSMRQLKHGSITLSNGQDGVLDELRAAGVSLTFAVIDACRNNPFTPLPGKKSAGLSRGLARINNQQGSFIVFSASAGQEALDSVPSDDANQKLSVFNRYFIPKLESNMYLEDAIAASQVETQALASTYGGHQQLPIYEDGTAGKTCLSDQCGVPGPVIRSKKEVAALPQKTDINLTIHEQMTRNMAVQQCDQAAGSLYHPDYLAGRMLVEPPTYDERDGKQGITACSTALASFPDQPRLLVNLALAHMKLENYDKAFGIFNELAVKGNTFSWGRLGRMHEYGLGVKQDYKQAVKWYQKAAEQGHRISQNSLGLMYQRGQGIEQDSKLAVKWFRKAAEQGYSNGQSNLGLMYQKGLGIEQDYKLAVKWLRKAAEQGYSIGQSNLGVMYQDGLGIEQDYEEAVKWYRNAAEQGYSLGQINLGAMYQNGLGIQQDYEEAVKWYRNAAQQGNSIGQFNLGTMYQNGLGIERDNEEAVKWYRKAAEQGQSNAQSNLGTMYQNGLGIEQDNEEAVKWYRKAAEQGNSIGQNKLGTMYQNGLGIEQDNEEAVKWYRKAAEQGYSYGQSNLGTMYQNGLGIEQDYKQALKWFRKAAEQGNSNGQNNLGLMYDNGTGIEQNYEEAVKWYRKAAEQGNSNAQNNLGLMYELGLGLPSNPQKAAQLYIASIELGSNWAINQNMNFETSKAIQSILKQRGLYLGAIDGKLGSGTKAAMRKLLP